MFYLLAVTTYAENSISTSFLIQNQGNANQYYAEILDSFKDEAGNTVYPDYYGGSYLDKSGNLVVTVCNNTANNRSKILTAAKNSPVYSQKANTINSISFVTVENSYKDIKAAYEEFNDLFLNIMPNSNEYAEIQSKICEFYIDDYNNCLTIGLELTDRSTIDTIKSLSSYPWLLQFTVAERAYANASVNPGGEITIYDPESQSASYYSIGFRCYYQVGSEYRQGLISAAHGYAAVSSTVKAGNQYGEVIGTVIQEQCSNLVDAVLISLEPGDTATNVTEYNQTSIVGGYYTTSVVTGSTVYLEGRTSYAQSGEILSASCTTIYSDPVYPGIYYIIGDLIKTNYQSAGGDSGGIVHQPINGNNILIGIHVASNNNNDIGYICQAKNIISAFNVVPY